MSLDRGESDITGTLMLTFFLRSRRGSLEGYGDGEDIIDGLESTNYGLF
jgi:hypothetical protein